MIIKKEFREFFLRNVKVTAGVKVDQEVNFPLTYNIIGKGSVFNRFLQNHFPSETVFRKLFESLTFKLNVEDTADINNQGLVRLASDQEALDRTEAGAGQFSNVIRPSHLPNIVNPTIGVNDIIDSTNTLKGITFQSISTYISTRFKRDFSVEVARDKSIVLNNSTQKIELDGDNNTPGNNKFYGTDATGIKGFFPILIKTYILDSYASAIGLTNTNGSSVATNMYACILLANKLRVNGDEVKIESVFDYTLGIVYLSLYVDTVLVYTYSFSDLNPAKVTSNYTIVYLGSTQILTIIDIEIYNPPLNTLQKFKHSMVSSFDPTINNTLVLKVTNGSSSTGINIKRAKTTLNLV
jgi:hypothetical protein